MKRYKVETISENTEKYFFIRDYDTMDIVLLPTKYLKHKIKSNRSPNTVRRSAFAICYYLEYLNEIQMEIPQVYELDFEKQNEHFVNFLYWLKAGNHTQKDNIKPIHNGTCNAYLEDVFRFFLYIEAQYEQLGDLKVLSYNYHVAANAVGVKKKLRYQSFKGYLKAEDRKVRPAEHEEIVTLLQACTNCRDQLLLLLIAETGFRIGEILGVNYAHFGQYLAEHTTSNTRKELLLPILNYCRKTLFLQSDEINWDANVWYLDRLHLPKNRINPSSSFASISFAEIPHPGDQQCAKEYMKYQFGVTSRAVSTITIGYHGLRNMLVWFNEQGQSICDCTKEQMERYIKELQNQQIVAKTYNEYLVGIYQFLSFLTVRGYAQKVPFRLEYYQKKVIPTHHDRSVSPEVCMEMLKKLPLLPEHLRCMYLNLWCIGLRISEVCTLKGNAYYRQGEDAWIQVYQVKMKTYKRIPISDGLYRIMQVYIKRNGIAPDDYLFTNRYGGAYRSQTFRYQMKKFCSDNAVEGGEYLFQSHDYRHTVATFFYDSGVSLQSIRDYLGHDYEEMTEQYIDYMPRKIAAANTEFFGKPGNILASCLKKGGKYGQ